MSVMTHVHCTIGDNFKPAIHFLEGARVFTLGFETNGSVSVFMTREQLEQLRSVIDVAIVDAAIAEQGVA